MLSSSEAYSLTVRQGPERARIAGGKEKDRKPVDPPPIIQLQINNPNDPAHNYLQSPYYFMCCTLWDSHNDCPAQTSPESLLGGAVVSSLHRLKDIDNTDGGFFVFGDLSVKREGEFRLRFGLFEMKKTEVVFIKSCMSDVFTVYAAKSFPGMAESTFLSRSFGDQGVRLRIRKETRTLLKRPASTTLRSDDFAKPNAPQSRHSWMAQAPVMPYPLQRSHSPKMMDYSDYDTSRKRPRHSIDSTDLYDNYNQRGSSQQQDLYNTIGQSLPAQNNSLVQTQNMNWNSNQPGISSPPAGDFLFRFAAPQSVPTSSAYISPQSRQASYVSGLSASSYDLQGNGLLGNTMQTNPLNSINNSQLRYQNPTYTAAQYTPTNSMTMPSRLTQPMSAMTNQTPYSSVDSLVSWDTPGTKRSYSMHPSME